MLQARVVAQLELVVAHDAVGLSHGGEELGLLHGVDTEVSFEIEIEVEHVLGVAGLLGHECEHPLADLVLGDSARRGRRDRDSHSRHSGFDDWGGDDWGGDGHDRNSLDRRNRDRRNVDDGRSLDGDGRSLDGVDGARSLGGLGGGGK